MADWIAQQAAAVAGKWFQSLEIPDGAIPALLQEYANGPPNRERYQRIARTWLDSHEFVADKWEEKKLPPTLAEPVKPTVASLRAELEQVRSEWIAGGKDRDNVFWANRRLAQWWNTARLIEGTAPPPPMPAPLPGRVSDIQQALAAADELLRWCADADAETKPTQIPKVPRRKRRDTKELILAALCLHHDYHEMSVGNWEPIKVRELSRLTKPTKSDRPLVSASTITRWFNENFDGGHSAYERQCADELLLSTLKRLNNDFTPNEMRDIDRYESSAGIADRRRDRAFLNDDS
jgi:hypothetical protein